MEIDLRPLPDTQRAELLLTHYVGLAPQQVLTVISDRSEQHLLELLQQRYGGAFEWYSLRDGPISWHSIIVKKNPCSARSRLVIEFMDADHRRFATMLEEIPGLVQQGNLSQLGTTLTYLETGLRKHIQMEEEILLPVIAEKLVSPRGPAAVLRDDHLRVLEMLGQLQQIFHEQKAREPFDGTELCTIVVSLGSFLANHIGMEERILYAVTDLVLNDEERARLFQRCQSVSAE